MATVPPSIMELAFNNENANKEFDSYLKIN
jgi:hypothetical protein